MKKGNVLLLVALVANAETVPTRAPRNFSTSSIHAMPHNASFLNGRKILSLISRHAKRAGENVDAVTGASPFVLLFASGSGSTVLWQRLTVTRGACMLGYEPLDDCRGKGEKSNLARKLAWMRIALTTPGGLSDDEKRARWRS